MPATLTEFVIVKSLALSKTSSEAISTTMLPSSPNSSSNATFPHFVYFVQVMLKAFSQVPYENVHKAEIISPL
jgi:hypothetical protein